MVGNTPTTHIGLQYWTNKENKMRYENITVIDRITIGSALTTKYERIKEMIEQDPTDSYWLDKLQEVESAYKNFMGRELSEAYK